MYLCKLQHPVYIIGDMLCARVGLREIGRFHLKGLSLYSRMESLFIRREWVILLVFGMKGHRKQSSLPCPLIS